MIPWFGQEGHNRANANEKDRICVHALRYETGAWPLWQRGQWPGHGDAAGHGDVAQPAVDAAGHGVGYAMQTIQSTEQPLLLQLMFLPFLPLLLQLTDALMFLPLLLQLLTPVPLYHILPQLLPTPVRPQHNRRR